MGCHLGCADIVVVLSDDVVAAFQKREQRGGDRAHPGGENHACLTPLQIGNDTRQPRRCRVAVAGIKPISLRDR